MLIGIDASRAFVKNRTGIEEYSYQVIKGLMKEIKDHQVVLYVRKNQKIDFELPEGWKVKVIRWPYLWTQIGLSLELLFHPVDKLFIPAHTVPIVHPEDTAVVIHGLEYEFRPKAYSFWERLYMRCVIKNSVRWAKKIVAVSENTKKDLINLYKVPKDKISVVYEGVSENFQSNTNDKIFNDNKNKKYEIIDIKYLLFIGRLEERKNILGIIDAFEILKEKYKVPHQLILVGNPGYGYEKIKNKISKCRSKEDIILKGFVSDEEKYGLLKNAEVFLFSSFYEGFGLPILEAQAVGTPVVTSNVSSMPEVADYSAILVDPNSPRGIADAVYHLISNENLKNDIINKGFENVKRFSWDRCAEEIRRIILC